jgi:hypothetical protein
LPAMNGFHVLVHGHAPRRPMWVLEALSFHGEWRVPG